MARSLYTLQSTLEFSNIDCTFFDITLFDELNHVRNKK